MAPTVSTLYDAVVATDPHQFDFHQAVHEVLESVVPIANAHPEYQREGVLERLLEPDRTLRFRVAWEDDEGNVHVNRGWRVQHSNALGPYKGGLRLHPTVNVGVLKFLAFEQTFKNALTGLPLGAGKGGSDFDPKGKSDREVMRFCQSFMTQLWRQIGPNTDVPAGDIGVGGREIGYLFGQYKRLAGEWTGTLTGKAASIGGIEFRTEATGYGAVIFSAAMLEHASNDTLSGKRCIVSGAGNVALHASEKLIHEGALVLTLSDSRGLMHFPEGMTRAQLDVVRRKKTEERLTLAEIADGFEGADYVAGGKPWTVEGELAYPCATQNELDGDDARTLAKNGCRAVVEGANMPCTPEAVTALRDAGVLFAPGKAANAGGVAVSGLEMAQNAGKQAWDRERVSTELERIMRHIHDRCTAESGTPAGEPVDYVRGANVAGFRRVADAICAMGVQ